MQRERIGLKRVVHGIILGLALYASLVPVRADAGTGKGDTIDTGAGAASAALPVRTIAPVTAAPVSNPALMLPQSHYPASPRGPVSDRMFGEAVPDPWRWLEADPRRDPAVAAWVMRQDGLARAYLAALPGRDRFAQSLRRLYDYPRYSLPRKAGRRYFIMRNSGLMNQSVLTVRDGLAGTDRVLVDPNQADDAKGGAYAIDGWVPSRSGRYLALSEQRAGSDWRTIRVVDANSGQRLDDRLDWANDTLIAWWGDKGFFYSRYPAPRADDAFRAPLHDKALWFHRVGTPQSADQPVYATPDQPTWGHKAQVTSDGRWVVISTDAGSAPARAIHLIDLRAAHGEGPWVVRPLVPELTHDWKLVDGTGDQLWFITNAGAPNYQLVQIEPAARDARDVRAQAKVVIGEQHGTLEAGRIVGDRLILSYLDGGQRLAMVTDLDGRPARAITVGGNGAATGFDGKPGDPETFYQFSSYNQPPTIFRMDLRNGRATPFATPAVPFDPADYVVEERQYPSRDGTMVPLTVVRKRTLARGGIAAPTLLYGYGGFAIALSPSYSPWRMAWLQAGGVLAVAAVRGGGELGPAWYEAGRGAHKQTSFDDFIAAGDYLLHSGIARPGSLAAQGGSNGGMMVAAVINQRPDLFVAANPDVGVMDMLRFDRFTQGRSWISDYGDPAREADWRTLRAYSPYHNIRDGADYPAILVTTADTDDRVVPAHSFKYVAALQAAAIGDRPRVLRVESDAGHGTGRPLDKLIASGADALAFLAAWTGLDPPPS
ncbi:prolyl oligopeptidase family serine peptidase [Novosphingobium sp.]|uniref:prolyl oligopeptidase family serine peptidase n=1 Tax=Novosphingobium sp. TaxID=1874826 RepID=UPI0033403672